MFDLASEFNFNMVDDQDRIMAFNRKNCENCNIKNEDEIVGRRIPECVPKVLADIYTSRNRRVRKSGTAIVNQTFTHGADRSTDIKVVSIFPLYYTSGRIIGTTCMNRSIESGAAKPDWYGLVKAGFAAAKALASTSPAPFSTSGSGRSATRASWTPFSK